MSKSVNAFRLFVPMFDPQANGPLVIAGRGESASWTGALGDDGRSGDYGLCPCYDDAVRVIRRTDGIEFLTIGVWDGPLTAAEDDEGIWVLVWDHFADTVRPVVEDDLVRLIRAPDCAGVPTPSPTPLVFSPRSFPLELWHAALAGSGRGSRVATIMSDDAATRERPTRFAVTAQHRSAEGVGKGLLIRLLLTP